MLPGELCALVGSNDLRVHEGQLPTETDDRRADLVLSAPWLPKANAIVEARLHSLAPHRDPSDPLAA